MNKNIRGIEYPDEEELGIFDPEPLIGMEIMIKNVIDFDLYLPVIDEDENENTKGDEREGSSRDYREGC